MRVNGNDRMTDERLQSWLWTKIEQVVIETYRTTGTEYVLFQEFLKQVCKEKWGADEEK